VVRNEQHGLRKDIAEVDEALVGDGSDPLEGDAAAGVVEDDFYMRAAGDGGEMAEGVEEVGVD